LNCLYFEPPYSKLQIRGAAMTEKSVKRKLTAILCADVKGYSRLMGEDEVGTFHTLSDYLEIMSTIIVAHRGCVFSSPGDAILAQFASVVDAVECAVKIQGKIEAENADVPSDRRMQFRIGVNLGDVIEKEEQIYGDGVNMAARIETLAEPGKVSISKNVYRNVRNKLKFGYENQGEYQVKNIVEPVRVYKVIPTPEYAGQLVGEPKAPRRISKQSYISIFAALVLVAIAAIWHFYLRAPEIEPAAVENISHPLPNKPSIAVLPFDNLSDEIEQEYFSDGITDDLITDLSKISGLFVIARNSVFTYKGKPVKVRQVAEELGVRYVLEGSVRKANDRVRINAQLIDAKTGGHLWAERYDREYADIFELQDEIIGNIVSAMMVKLTGVEQTRLVRRPTDNLEAYDYYLRAERGAYTEDYSLFIDALSLYEKAIEMDPDFAAAYAGYARVVVDVWRFSYGEVLAGPVARKQAYKAASRALTLDTNIPRAYSVLGILQAEDGRYDEALASVRKAVSLGPNSADAYVNLAIVLISVGKPVEALEAMETTLRLNPRPSPGVLGYYGVVLFMNRQYKRALEPLMKARESCNFAREFLAMTYAQLDRLDDAKVEIENLLEKYPDMCLAFMQIAHDRYKRETDRVHILDALSKAGLPPWPSGFEGLAENRLDGNALKKLAHGRTWVGHTSRDLNFIQEIGEDWKFAFRSPETLMTGVASVQRDRLCLNSEFVLFSHERCGHVYRNPGGTLENKNAYVYVNPTNLLFFSPVH
jgi:adenylate cyclase